MTVWALSTADSSIFLMCKLMRVWWKLSQLFLSVQTTLHSVNTHAHFLSVVVWGCHWGISWSHLSSDTPSLCYHHAASFLNTILSLHLSAFMPLLRAPLRLHAAAQRSQIHQLHYFIISSICRSQRSHQPSPVSELHGGSYLAAAEADAPRLGNLPVESKTFWCILIITYHLL